MMRVSGHRAPVVTSMVTRRLWRVAVLTATGAFATASTADAALYYWSDSAPGISRPGPAAPQRRQTRHQQGKKVEAPEKESAKPQGALIIAISIDRQTLKVYDTNGFYAETPISTGMPGHPTPMGVFSIIQKHKLHHSNIYSGAPMPFMQRITWSGVAMHAGVLPGHPASHGCIRMPLAFAMKMWNWTKMGARVVVTPGEMVPTSFSHPLLAAQKVVPQPVAAGEPQTDTPPAAKADNVADAVVKPTPAASEAALELRPTVGHNESVKAVMDEPSAPAPLRDPTRTADAGNTPATKAAVTMTDASPSGGKSLSRDEAPATDKAPSKSPDAVSAKADASPKTEPKSEEVAKTEPAKSEADPAAAKRDAAASDAKPAESKSASADIKAPETKSPTIEDEATKKPEDKVVAAQPRNDAPKTEAIAAEPAKAEEKTNETKVEAKADAAKPEAPKPDAAKASEKPAEILKAVTDTGAIAPDAKKDQTRLPDTAKPAGSKPDPTVTATPKRSGQIAVFVSRKDSKLYARQNFAPLFDAPVTIAPSDRPLGTHVFTAEVDKSDANVLHWSVVTLPTPRHVERRDEDERASRRRKIAGAGAIEVKATPVPDSPAEALDRLSIPADVMARIAEALTTGGSIIVSDQGINAGETGEGTDFIVSLR